MSSYRSYAPWTKTPSSSNSTTTSSSPHYQGPSTIKRDTPASSSTNKTLQSPTTKFDTSFGSRSKKPEEPLKTTATSRIASKYGAYTGSYTPTGGGSSSKLGKPFDTKKTTDHPPISYRGLGAGSTTARAGSRSRDPSPDKTSSSSYSQGRLYPPKSYTRQDTSGGSTIPKYTGRASLTKDSSSSSTREPSNNKYINSRFLPKNSVEKSYTAYTRPSTIRTHEASRKNRELLSVLHAQQEQERSRPPSRCSIVTTPEPVMITSITPLAEPSDLVTVTVVTRATSPTQQSGLLRNRRVDIAKTVEKEITRPRTRSSSMADKEVQSDRLDDSTKTSRFVGASRIATSATPWSSFLDMKFNSPGGDPSKTGDTPKSLSRNSSTKSVNSSKKTSPSPPKGAKNNKTLPPQIPISATGGKQHSLVSTNKDFRKSVLNMNPDGTKKTRKSTSGGSSSESDFQATDVSENLSSCVISSAGQGQGNKVSRLPQRSRRSPSSDTSSSSSGIPDEDARDDKEVPPKPPPSPRTKTNTEAAGDAKNFLMRALAPVTNLFAHNTTKKGATDDTSCSVSLPKDDQNSPTASTANQTRPLRRVDSRDKLAWWEDSSPATTTSDQQRPIRRPNESSPSSEQQVRPMRRMDSREKVGWWEEPTSGGGVSTPSDQPPVRRIDSREKVGWWEESGTGTPSSPSDLQVRRLDSREKVGWWEESAAGSAPPQEQQQQQQLRPMRRIDSREKVGWWEETSGSGPSDQGKPVMRRIDSRDKIGWWEDTSGSHDNNNIMDPDYQERHKIRHIDSGERSWWLSSSENIPEMVEATQASAEQTRPKPRYAIRHRDSGEAAQQWWLNEEEESPPLGDRASPDGLEMPKEQEHREKSVVPGVRSKKVANLFISKHTNIDDILGGSSQIWSPLMDRIFGYQEGVEVDAGQVKIHDSTPQRGVIQPTRIDNLGGGVARIFSPPSAPFHKLDDAALQLYKDGDYGSYLDLEASISEQQEEFEGFQTNKKNSIVLRTQLSVRVHTIIEKLLTSEGRELRRSLFSLKQIFQEDKDLVHEFVQNDGLSCLIKVGSEADQNYQNYILRALGQVMLYVDGMNGVMEHNQTVQWLYSLISSKFRLVVKTALKLLLVFVEYTESNCLLLIQAVNVVDYGHGVLPWHNIMRLLKDFDSADTELLIYATTLINKVLNGVPDQDTYYDQTDSLEEQEIERIIQRYMSKPGTDLDLLQQFQIYEAVLQYEDGEDFGGTPIRHLDESIRKTLRIRKSVVHDNNGNGIVGTGGVGIERRKSRRHSTGTAPPYPIRNSSNNANSIIKSNNGKVLKTSREDDDESSSSSQSSNEINQINGCYKDSNKATDAGVTPALRRRRERAERQRSFMKEQQESCSLFRNNNNNNNNNNNIIITNGDDINESDLGSYATTNQRRMDIMNHVNKLDSERYDSQQANGGGGDLNNSGSDKDERGLLLQLKRENTVKDLTQKLANQNILTDNGGDNVKGRIGDMSGLISKAKEGLAKSKSKADVLKSSPEAVAKCEPKKTENELRWEELVANLDRPLNLCDMDFTDLASDDETDLLAPVATPNGIPPPPPLQRNSGGAPPPPPSSKIPPPVPPSLFGVNLQRPSRTPSETKIPIKKNKKTVKLFWKEVRDDPVHSVRLKTGYIWDELKPVSVDTQKLEHLFESRAKDLITKKQQEMNKNKEIIVLDPKRSNAINIGMTKLPPPRSIKTAILKMDATIMNREGIEKLLTMLPTEEERSKIQDAQSANPDLPLGSAEQFLLTLASISELPARLRLWAFKLDFENSEREIAEPLMDLKQGLEVLRANKTFRGILSTLLSIGNFLNGNEVKGFQIEYLAKVPEVKDTVHKHSLLHHLCHIVMEKFPDATDLYSEIGAITRASKIDFDELSLNIQRLESDCKASWDHLKLIAKHDGSTMMKVKMSDFLSDCAERIILVGIIHRRVTNRYHRFLLWLGIPLHQIGDTKPNEFCRVVSEFALEYRTTRERVLQQLEKKANHRERNKTRGKMITDVGKFRTKEDRADAELRQLLGSDISDVESMQGTLPWRRTRRESNNRLNQSGTLNSLHSNMTDCDDEILESLVKTATKGPNTRTAPRERKRTRHADRKSLRRTLKNGLSEEEKKHLSAYIKGY